jgi:hypothetical protein
MKLKVTLCDAPYERQAKIENPEPNCDDWDNTYVSISGHFGPHGPHMFAAAPDLYEALKMAALWLDIEGRFDMMGINAALAKARGDAT